MSSFTSKRIKSQHTDRKSSLRRYFKNSTASFEKLFGQTQSLRKES
uniref:Uncharacterized protein n=1 Tax=Rhizophora mucronata TaxID=61149 RepID=A0A2P2PVV1_RHIMU